MVLALGGDVLVGDEVHAVAGRGDETDIGHGVQSGELLKGDGLVEKVDGHELDGAELAVDATHELVHDGAEVLILFNVLTRGHGDLYEDNLADPLGVLGQEDLERVELLGHALDVVEAVHTDDELDALELAAQRGYALLHLGLLESLDELVRVDADGEGADGDELALPVDAAGGRRRAEYPRAATQEVAGVVVRVEADEVAVEQAGEEGLADGEDAVDLGGGEGCVEEEADADVLLGVANLLAQHLGEEHEVVVVHPDQVAVLDVLDDRLGEEAVDFLVCGPSCLVKCDLTRVVMEERPEDGICESKGSVQI